MAAGKKLENHFKRRPRTVGYWLKLPVWMGTAVKPQFIWIPPLKSGQKGGEKTDYDPRKRPWFAAALASARMIKIPPYFFSLLKAPGVTYARKVEDGQRVVAVDIYPAGLSEFLQRQRFIPAPQAFVVKNGARIEQIPALRISDTTVPLKICQVSHGYQSARPSLKLIISLFLKLAKCFESLYI